MWVGYKDVMALLEVSHSVAYKVIKKLQEELEKQGYIANPNRKIPIAYLCKRYCIDEDYARRVIADLKKKE